MGINLNSKNKEQENIRLYVSLNDSNTKPESIYDYYSDYGYVNAETLWFYVCSEETKNLYITIAYENTGFVLPSTKISVNFEIYLTYNVSNMDYISISRIQLSL